MSESAEVTAARGEVDRRRAQLIATARELQLRTSPKTLARGAWEGAKEKGAGLAEEAVDAVAKRPVAIGAVATAVALFVARGPLIELAGRLIDRDADDGQASKKRASPRKSKTELKI